MTSKDDLPLISELKRKYAGHDTTNFGLADFLSRFGSPVDAVMYACLFWPQFVRFEEMVFRAETLQDEEDRQRVRLVLAAQNGDRTQTEEALNLVDLPSDVFARQAAESGDAADAFLARLLSRLWVLKLEGDFPGDRFQVRLASPEENGGEWGIVFSTKRTGAQGAT